MVVSFVSIVEGHNRFANGLLAQITGFQNKLGWSLPSSQYLDNFLLDHLDFAGRKLEALRLVWRLPWLMNSLARVGCDKLMAGLDKRRTPSYTDECRLECSSSSPVLRILDQSPVSAVRLLGQVVRLSSPAFRTTAECDARTCSQRLPLQVVGRMRSYVQQFEQGESASTATALVDDSLDWLRTEAEVKLIPVRFELHPVGGQLECVINAVDVSSTSCLSSSSCCSSNIIDT